MQREIWNVKTLSYEYIQANGEAAQGKYVAGTCVGAAAAYDLFIKNHAY